MKHLFLVTITFFTFHLVTAQNDSIFIRKIYDEALSKGKAYADLRSLCKDVGARLSGSAQAQMAVEWGEAKMKGYGFDKVYLQEIKVPHWERGTKEAAWIKHNNQLIQLHILALGAVCSNKWNFTWRISCF
jgi:carboxypeptidase Q